MNESDIWLVWQAYQSILGPVRQVDRLGAAGGLSGSRLWRMTTTAGSAYCLRRWPPEHPDAERLQFIHEVLRAVGKDLPIVARPVAASCGRTFFLHDGHYWEVTPWLAGQPDCNPRPPEARLIAAMRALATFHTLASTGRTIRGPAPAIADRLRLINGARAGELERIEACLAHPQGQWIAEAPSGGLDVPCGRLLTAVKRVLSEQAPEREAPGDQNAVLIPAIRDIHREHVLFESNAVTGIVDFGAMRMDTPLTDVARLLGSLAGDDAAARVVAKSAYRDLRPLSAEDERTIDWLDATGQVGAAIHWLRWLYVERRDLGSREHIAGRLQSIETRLEHLLQSVRVKR